MHHCQNLNEKFFVPQKNCTRCIKKEKENSLIQWTFSLPQTERAKRRKVKTRIKPRPFVYHSCFECRTERCYYYKRKIDNGEPEKKMIWADCSSLMYLCIYVHRSHSHLLSLTAHTLVSCCRVIEIDFCSSSDDHVAKIEKKNIEKLNVAWILLTFVFFFIILLLFFLLFLLLLLLSISFTHHGKFRDANVNTANTANNMHVEVFITLLLLLPQHVNTFFLSLFKRQKKSLKFKQKKNVQCRLRKFIMAKSCVWRKKIQLLSIFNA